MSHQIFISYRRDGGESLAYLLYEKLTHEGYDVFLDVESLRSGKFNTALYKKIEECIDFLLILPPNGLDRCTNSDDWVRMEIERAIKCEKNIIPLMMRGFEFPHNLPETLQELPNFNGISANMELFDGVLLKLKNQFLHSKPLDITRTEDLNKEPIIGRNDTGEQSDLCGSTLNSKNSSDSPSIDYQLNEKFEELFGPSKPKENTNKKSPMEEKLLKIKSRNFISLIEQKIKNTNTADATITFNDRISLVPIEYNNNNSECMSGKHFILPDISGFKTIIFEVYRNVDYKTLTEFYTCEPLDFMEQKKYDGSGTETVYFVDDPQEDGNQLVILHFNNNDGEMFVNTGLLLGDSVKMTKMPMSFTLHKQRFDEQPYLSSATFDMDSLTDTYKEAIEKKEEKDTEKWREADIDDAAAIIIDPETAVPVRRKIYYDDKSGELKAKIKISPYKNYFVFQIRNDDYNTLRTPLSNLEIARYYTNGDYGFPKDILQAIQYFEEDGTAQAFYEIACIFRNDSSIFDKDSYIEYLKKAMDMGCVAAKVEFALNLCLGDNVHEQEEGQNLLKKLVKDDSVSDISFFILGYLIESGAIEKNIEDAFEYYMQAAHNSYKPACARLGQEKITADKETIKNYFLANLDYGNTIAEYCMGCILFFGQDLLPNEKRGLELLNKSAEKGNKMAMYALSDIYNNDSEFNDDEKLLMWLKEIVQFDSSISIRLANRLLDGVGCTISEENDKLAFELLQKAAKDGNSTAIHNLGWTYKEGRGCICDYEMARKLFEKAKKPNSFYYLGNIYERGLGVPLDLDKAIEYYQKGAEEGSKKAKKRLEELQCE